MPVFDDGKLFAVESTKENFLRYGIDPKYRSNLKTREDSIAKLKMASVAYMQMADYMTELWKKRGVEWTLE